MAETWSSSLGNMDTFENGWEGSEFLVVDDGSIGQFSSDLNTPEGSSGHPTSSIPSAARTTTFTPPIPPAHGWQGPAAPQTTTQPRRLVRRLQSTTNLSNAQARSASLPGREKYAAPKPTAALQTVNNSAPPKPSGVSIAQVISNQSKELQKLAPKVAQLSESVEQINHTMSGINRLVEQLSMRVGGVSADLEQATRRTSDRILEQNTAIDNVQDFITRMENEMEELRNIEQENA